MEEQFILPSIFSENLFDDFFNSAMFPKAEHELYGKHAKNLMNTDVREVENGYEIDMNLPGFKKDEVEIQLQDGCLCAVFDLAASIHAAVLQPVQLPVLAASCAPDCSPFFNLPLYPELAGHHT